MWTLVIVGIIYILWAVFSRKESKTVIRQTDPTTGLVKQVTRQIRQPRSLVEIEKPDPFEITEEIRVVLDILENTSTNIFLTGKAGTGKSTLLKYFRATTNKYPVVVAPTGVAAVNVQGQTIHRFFGWNIDITPERVRRVSYEKARVYREMKMLIIDEISMVRADLFQCIDQFLRMNRNTSNIPFGGVQIVAIGDLYQLPPVVKGDEKSYIERVFGTPFFFSAPAFVDGCFKKFELNNIFRQTDKDFIEALNHIREGVPKDSHFDLINRTVIKDEPEDFHMYIRLVPTNALAQEINQARMNSLPSQPITYNGFLSGEFAEKDIPTEMQLTLKVGARVMLLNNDKRRRWVNGEVVTILETKTDSIVVEFDDNTVDEIVTHTWETVKFIFDEEEKKIVPIKAGSFTQIPVKLAWAITIHKSQGKTFEKMFVDMGSGAFAEGQTYVALSRSKGLEGLKLASPLRKEDVFVNKDVKKFMSFSDSGSSDKETSLIEGGLFSDIVPCVDDKELTKQEYVLASIRSLRRNGYLGIHVVYSGFNKSFREKYHDDPVAYIKELVSKKIVYTHLVKGGVMMYNYKEYMTRR